MKSKASLLPRPGSGRPAPGANGNMGRPPPLLPASLDLVGWRRLDEGSLELSVRYAAATAACPHCQEPTAQVHSRRIQRKRDQDWQGRPLWLLLERRRFRCWSCQRVFTQPDPVCGSRRRTTRRRRAAGPAGAPRNGGDSISQEE